MMATRRLAVVPVEELDAMVRAIEDNAYTDGFDFCNYCSWTPAEAGESGHSPDCVILTARRHGTILRTGGS